MGWKQNKTITTANHSTAKRVNRTERVDYGEHIDWHDYEFIEKEKQRQGFGEGGRGETLPEDEKQREKWQMKRYGFNGVISDKIALNRSIRDTRPEK